MVAQAVQTLAPTVRRLRYVDYSQEVDKLKGGSSATCDTACPCGSVPWAIGDAVAEDRQIHALKVGYGYNLEYLTP
jgi:hypothetical protein